DTLHVLFDTMPVISAGPGIATCQGKTIEIDSAVVTGNPQLIWTHNGRGVLTGETTIHPSYVAADNETGTVVLTLKVFGAGSCSDSAVYSTTSIEVYTVPEVNAGPDHLIEGYIKDTLNATYNGGSGNYSIIWDPAGQISATSAGTAITVPLNEETTFTVTVNDLTTGCSATDTMIVHIKEKNNTEPECLIVYNYITPNGDGLNDTWIIDCMETYPENSVEIFNIWGDLIKHFDNYNNHSVVWNGTNLQDKPVPDGTYYYVMRIPGKKAISGWVFVRS
ncbi:MAG: gliding motility-associated C-terminal domain-containing protein, partial [Syntrophothermus sp.]